MPFASKAQQRFMFARHPRIAKRWAREYGVPKNLPERSRRRHAPSTAEQAALMHRRLKKQRAVAKR